MRALTFALALLCGCSAPLMEKSSHREVVTVQTTTGVTDGVGVRIIREERVLRTVNERVEEVK